MTTSPIVSITDELLAELEAAANAATKGRWCTDGDTWICAQDSDQLNNGFVLAITQGPDERKNAVYMAKASASVILALLAERDDLKRQLVAAGITAENCELFRKDAQRYAWLREMHNDGYGDLWVSRWNYEKTEWVSLDAFCRPDYDGELDLDAAIDAARSAGGGS